MEGMYDRIQRLVKEKGFRSVAELERICNFKARTFVEWNNHQPAMEKVSIAAKALGVTPDYILSGVEEEKQISTDELKYALWGGENGMTDEQFREVMQFANFVKERDSKK